MIALQQGRLEAVNRFVVEALSAFCGLFSGLVSHAVLLALAAVVFRRFKSLRLVRLCPSEFGRPYRRYTMPESVVVLAVLTTFMIVYLMVSLTADLTVFWMMVP